MGCRADDAWPPRELLIQRLAPSGGMKRGLPGRGGFPVPNRSWRVASELLALGRYVACWPRSVTACNVKLLAGGDRLAPSLEIYPLRASATC